MLVSSSRVRPHAALPLLALAFPVALAACASASKTTAVAPATSAAFAEPEAPAAQAAQAEHERPGLGTAWGEAVSSQISFRPFERASREPWAALVLHYNDADGAAAHAAYLGARPAPLEVDAGEGALSVAVTDDDGRPFPGFAAGDRTLVIGEDGARYKIVVRNRSAARFEVVASVDGLDVLDGQPASPGRRGYLVEPHGELTIDGFRTSSDAVAAFRFGRVADSYAAQTAGDRNVGVIGMAIFRERGAPPVHRERSPWTPDEVERRDSADPFPAGAERGYAAPPPRTW